MIQGTQKDTHYHHFWETTQGKVPDTHTQKAQSSSIIHLEINQSLQQKKLCLRVLRKVLLQHHCHHSDLQPNLHAPWIVLWLVFQNTDPRYVQAYHRKSTLMACQLFLETNAFSRSSKTSPLWSRCCCAAALAAVQVCHHFHKTGRRL